MQSLGRIIYWIRVRPISRLGRASRRFFVRSHPQRTLYGIMVIDATKDRSRSAIYLDQVAESLDLIKKYDSKNFRRASTTLDSIEVVSFLPKNSQAYYLLGTNTCYLHEKLMRRGISTIAAAIAHEVTHARLDRMGIRQSKDRYDRVERLCKEEESRFLRRYVAARTPEEKARDGVQGKSS